ncbi:MAG TPA: hypothetical protein VFR11_06765 [Micromonosporaceae bacterium]|jgi:hypothetical protein|nr:hypothetical protein [Micromonosporaceae bacterium]
MKAPQSAMARCRRIVARARSIAVDVTSRFDRWRLGLDVEFAEYDAYRHQTRYRTRASAIAAFALLAIVVTGIVLLVGVARGSAAVQPVGTAPSPASAAAPEPPEPPEPPDLAGGRVGTAAAAAYEDPASWADTRHSHSIPSTPIPGAA